MNIKTEYDTRKEILKQAHRFLGPEAVQQVKMHFNKWDKIIKNCNNDTEKSHMKKMAIAELYKLMGYYQGLTVNGEEIIPPEKK